MKFAELKKFFTENQNATEEDFNAKADSMIDWDFTRKKIETPEGSKALQSFLDRERTKAVQTFEEKTVPARVEKMLAEKLLEKEKEWKKYHNIKDDPALIEVDKLREELRQARTEAQREKLMGIAKSKLPSELHGFAERFLDEDEERTNLRVESLIDAYNKSVDRVVEMTLKGGKNTPAKGNSNISGKEITRESLKTMSDAEILANPEAALRASGFSY